MDLILTQDAGNMFSCIVLMAVMFCTGITYRYINRIELYVMFFFSLLVGVGIVFDPQWIAIIGHMGQIVILLLLTRRMRVHKKSL